MKAIILAAGRGSRMGPLTDAKPKCLTRLSGRTLLDWQIAALGSGGADEIVIVGGYRFESLNRRSAHLIENQRWEQTNMAASLACAAEHLRREDCLVSYSDIVYHPDTVAGLWAADGDIAIAYDELWLRVRPETLCRITEFSEHESNGRELDEGERVAVEVLPVLGQSAAAVEPGDGAFDPPTPGLDDEALHPIGSLDDLGLEIGQDAGQGAVKDRPLIGAVGEQFPEKGKQTEQGRQQRETAVAILNVGGGDDAVQQQALRIDQNMPLLALDQLAGIEAVAVDASLPFSALFTL